MELINNINKTLYKKAVFEKFNLKAVERDRFDADISRMTLVAKVSTATVPALTKGKEIEGFYVLQVALKRKDYDTKNILMLQKLIPQKLIFALLFEEQIIHREQREKLLRQIESLEKQCRTEKQTRKKYELHQQIVKLKKQL